MIQRWPVGGKDESHTEETTVPGERNGQCFEGTGSEWAFLTSSIPGAGLGKMNTLMRGAEERANPDGAPGLSKPCGWETRKGQCTGLIHACAGARSHASPNCTALSPFQMLLVNGFQTQLHIEVT